MRFTIFSFLLLTVLAYSACKTRYTSPKDYPKAQLVFGSGGGFAGTVKTYHLLQDGAIFYVAPGDTTLQKINQIKKKTAKDLFAQAEALSLSIRSFNQPGNMYAFVEWRTPEREHRLVWDMSGMGVDPDLMDFHQELMQYAIPTR
jgi:hypothetical protein